MDQELKNQYLLTSAVNTTIGFPEKYIQLQC